MKFKLVNFFGKGLIKVNGENSGKIEVKNSYFWIVCRFRYGFSLFVIISMGN